MPQVTPSPFFGTVASLQLLDGVVDAVAESLSTLLPFELGEAVGDDRVESGRLPSGDAVRIAFRIGYRSRDVRRIGIVQMPLPAALVLAGSLVMAPAGEVRAHASRPAPDERDKAAILEAGRLLAGAIDEAVRDRVGRSTEATLIGCQGVAAGRAPWVPGYAGEPFAVRVQTMRIASFDPFEMTIAIPA
ncbi:MAG: hypothetical protein AAF726_20355 [Planctomycetota bacterium]